MSTKNSHIKLGKRIKHVLSMQEDLQKNIAKKAGCQPTEISRWVRGEVAPTYNKLVGIGRACKLSGDEISWLFDGKGTPPNFPNYENLGTQGEDKDAVKSPPETTNTSSKPSPRKDREDYRKDSKEMDLLQRQDDLIDGLKETISLLREKISFLETQLPKKTGANKKKVNGG